VISTGELISAIAQDLAAQPFEYVPGLRGGPGPVVLATEL
jgi:hypothetical protein